jgi:hypothetical protein
MTKKLCTKLTDQREGTISVAMLVLKIVPIDNDEEIVHDID